MSKSSYIRLSSLAFFFALLVSQSLPAMTLAEAVSFAMEHNRDILSVQEEVYERHGQVVEARAEAFPQFNLARA